MANYPDWVLKHKEKGTTIRKMKNKYYKYKVHSERKPGKKYPVLVHDELLGVITEGGFVPSTKKIINPSLIEVNSLYSLLISLDDKCFFEEIKESLETIFVIKINNEWYLTKTTPKQKEIINRLNLGEKYGKFIRNI